MCEVQGEVNVVYSDVCVMCGVREMLCTVMCVSEVQGGVNIVYRVLCVRYRLRKMSCTVKCVSEE